MKRILYRLTVLTIGVTFNITTAKGQAQCASPTPLTIGANDATCNSVSFTSTGVDFDDNVPTAITTVTNTCGVAASYNANWYSFTGDGTTIRIKIFNQNNASTILVFQNQACAASMSALTCSSFPDDNLPHVLDINTVNGASYKIAVLRQSGSSSFAASLCAFKTSGLPYSPICDATPVALTVKTKNVDCFAAGNYVNVNTSTAPPAPPTPCQASATFDEWWIGKFTAIDTKTELYFWGKDEANASIEVLRGPCSGSMTSVFCNNNTGAKDVPNWGSMTTVVGQDYYVIVKTSGSSDFGRLCIYSQPVEPTKPFCTPPMSFEDGAGAGWVLGSGAYHLVSAPGNTWTYTYPTVGASPSAKFMVTSGTGVDPIVGGMLPVVAPGGGTYSFRLGDNVGAGYTLAVPGQAGTNQSASERIYFDFVVSAANAGFGYKYATVMDNAGHAAEIQNMFEVLLTLPNSGGTVVPCGNYTHIPNDGTSPFKFIGDNTDVSGSLNYCFTPWTDVVTDLSGYVGQTVRATFRVRDCMGGCTGTCTSNPYTDPQAGGHWAYSYIDTYCTPMNITVPEFCAGAGSIQICALPGYKSYSWPAGQPGLAGSPTTQCVTINAPVGGTTYTVVMTSVNNCPVTAKVVIKNIPLTVTTPTSVCPNTPATISVAVTTSINPPYTFNWSHGLGTGSGPKTVTPAATTTYTVTVTNGLGCSSTQAVTVNVAPCGINVTTTPATVCNGVCGTITSSASGGTPGYTYSWSPGGATTSSISVCPASTTTYTVTARDNNGSGSSATATAVVTVNANPPVNVNPATICNGNSTTLTATGANTYIWSPTTGLSAGTGATVTANPTATTTYTVVGTTTTTGCTGSTTVIVTVNPKPTVTVPPASICPGGSTPVTASGATTYTWSPGTGLSATTGNPVTANPASTTTYTVIGTSLGCTGSATVVVTVGALVANAGPDAAICSGNSTTLGASGGTIFTWTPATGLSNASISNPVASPTTTTTYTVLVSDGNCSDDDVVIVTVNPNPVVTVPPATICSGKSATLTASGATTYTWAPTTGLSAGTGTSVTANPTTTTTYTVTGSFATGCTGVTTVVVTVNPNPTITSNPATICQGQSTPLTANGADTYTWSPTTGLSAGTGSNVTANPTVTTTYTIVGTTTASGCTGSATVIVTVIPPCGPNVAATGMTVCNGVCSMATSTASGGVPPYTYSWNSGETTSSISVCPTVTTTYTVTVTDNSAPIGSASALAVITVNPNPVVTVPSTAICNGSSTSLTASGATTYSWNPTTGLSAGTGTTVTANPTTTTTYTVTGSFATGCTGTTTVVVTVNPIPVVSVPNASICPGGSTVLNATGATTYTWSPTTGLSAGTGASVTANPATTTTYTVIGTSLGCTGSTTVVVSVGALVADAGPDVFICYGASTTLNASGGTIFTWTPATGLSNPSISNPIASPTTTTTYTVNVSDGNCSDDDVVVVTVNPQFTLNAAGVDVTCFGACNGQTIVIPTGGTAPYSYAWSSGCTAAACNNVCAGTYNLTATDSRGCTATASATVIEPTALTVSTPAITPVTCFGLCDGSASVTANGGTTGYTYSWTPSGGATANATNLCAGSYTLIVTDANNCTAKTNTTISQPTQVVVNSTAVSICPGETATLNTSASGGTPGYTYSWNPGSLTGSTVSVNPLVTTTYNIAATDLNGCTGGTSVVVTVQPTPVITVPAAAICQGASTTLTASGANLYLWAPSTGLSSATGNPVTANPAVTTTYTVVGTSAVGCTGVTTVVVTVNSIPVLTTTSAGACPGNPIPLTVSGATSYSWSPSNTLSSSTDSSVIARPPVTTVYTIIGIGANGCTATATATATVSPQPMAQFTSSPQPTDIFNPTIHFTDQSSGGPFSMWNWSFGDPKDSGSSLQNPSFTYPDTANKYFVKLTVVNQYGCTDSTVGIVYIKGIFTFYIPNTFTPDDDGVNDVFLPKGVGVDESDYDLWIFDRWGNMIWHTSTWGEAWDGKANGGSEIAQIDTYVWKVHVKEKEAGTIHNYIGHVNIVK